MLWAGLVFGLLGSFHCVGMCGPIALTLPGAGGDKATFLAGRVLYNGGRVLTYTLLGVVAGLVGAALPLAGMQQTVSIVSGLLILLLVLLPANPTGKAARRVGGDKLVISVKRNLVKYLGNPSPKSLGMAGLLNGLLPCGLVYVALAGAIAAGGLGHAALYMFLFGMGTLPLMLFVSLSGALWRPAARHYFRRAVPYISCFFAVLFILRGLNLGIPYVSPKMQQDPVTKEITSACCHKPENK